MARILVVDDEPDVVELISAMLQKAGYQTEPAYSGKEALRLLEEKEFNLVLLDLMMPTMHGFDVCKEIEMNPMIQHIPIIVVTAKGEIETIEKAYKCSSVVNYIAKPFEREHLLKVVGGVFEQKKTAAKKVKPEKVPDVLFKKIFEHYPEGMAILDEKNVISDVNGSFEAITGYNRDVLIGNSNFFELLKPQDDEGHRLLMSEAFKACFCEDPTSTAIFTIINKEGVKIKVVATIFKPLPTRPVMILRNITSNGNSASP